MPPAVFAYYDNYYCKVHDVGPMLQEVIMNLLLIR